MGRLEYFVTSEITLVNMQSPCNNQITLQIRDSFASYSINYRICDYFESDYTANKLPTAPNVSVRLMCPPGFKPTTLSTLQLADI